MHPLPLPSPHLHALARARAHELREEALDQAWAAVVAGVLRAWRAAFRRPHLTLTHP